MITFDNGRFEAHRDRYQWVLTEHLQGKDRDGNPKMQTKQTYHNNLRNMCTYIVCTYIVDRCADDCTTTAEIVYLLQNSERLLDVESHTPLP